MNSPLIADQDNGVKDDQQPVTPVYSVPVRVIAKIISYIFHPVFVPVYIMAFLLYVHPYIFAGYPAKNKIIVLAQSFMMLTFFPLVSVLLLKALKFINSIYLYTQKDRIIPFIACMTWYFWLWYVWNNMGKAGGADMPPETVQLAMGIFITSIIGLMINIKIKISLHAISMGLLITFMLLLGFSQQLNFGTYLSVAILITGLVCTQQEVYGGLAVGVISMLIGYWVG